MGDLNLTGKTEEPRRRGKLRKKVMDGQARTAGMRVRVGKIIQNDERERERCSTVVAIFIFPSAAAEPRLAGTEGAR